MTDRDDTFEVLLYLKTHKIGDGIMISDIVVFVYRPHFYL